MTAAAKEMFGGGLAVITGAGSGIGEGIAKYAASLGMRVVVADIDTDAATRVADQIAATGAQAWPMTVDVRSAEHVDALAESCAELGQVTLLVNNAGIEQFGYLWDTPLENWQRIVDVNISGVFHGIRSFVPRMIAGDVAGHIWNLSSVGAMTSIARQAPYLMSKHAVLGLTEALKLDLDHIGASIRVAVVLPGAVASRIFESAGTVGTGDVIAAEVARSEMLDLVPNAMDPVDAARFIFAQAATGEFYLLPQPDAVGEIMLMRGEQLAARRAPVDRRAGPGGRAQTP